MPKRPSSSSGPSAAKKRYRATLSSSSSARVCGPGIFLTCVRGKERRAADEAVAFLNEVADNMYAGVVCTSETPRHAVKVKQGATGAGGEEDDDEDEDDDEARPMGAHAVEVDEDDLDALRNAAPAAPAASKAQQASTAASAPASASPPASAAASTPPPAPRAKPAPAPAPAPVMSDIEAQIAAELAELAAAHEGGAGGGPSSAAKGKGKGAEKPRDEQGNVVPSPRRRFEIVETGTECLRFISVAPPLDPFRLVLGLMEEVERTGEARSRFVQRLSPVAGTSRADLKSVEALARELLPRWFASSSAQASLEGAEKGVTYKVEPHIRSHTSLSRDDVIRTIASCVPCDAGHAASLSHPDVWIMFEGIRNVCGLGVSKDYLKYKKYNPQQLAEATRKKKEESERAEGLTRVAAPAAGKKEDGKKEE
ncbi:hypothetical protein FA09DRAFT_330150 [Tilletiopsis washingtonensis]|uniref:THUMP domain-containing protein n=1 Tax=Tilletiopsis washingtonensis TaxID=58919 RepID=A0A316ZCI8_9BASI|nr:hypothetical protein FA09DRAFT_330150 [Tilletiopsis washingtonensis]PWN97995.1 hypothetical protein FA09DRAFT_330150 [Tilletiopsis washingtonensis]